MSRLSRWLRRHSTQKQANLLENGETSPPINNGTGQRREIHENIQVGRYVLEPRLEVESRLEEADIAEIFSHITSSWRDIGEKEPYESVLYSPIFKMESIEE